MTPTARERARAGRGRFGGAGRDLRIAVASGLLLAVVLLGSLALHPYAFLTFVAAVVVVALLELDVAFRAAGARPATPVAIGTGVLMVFGSYHSGVSAQALGLVLLTFGSIAWALLDVRRSRVAGNLGATFLMALWVPFLGSFAGLLLMRDQGTWYLLATVALTVTNDIGAYAFGTRFGRTHMASKVSPAKTWEGFGGGLATTLVVAAAVTSRVPGFDLATALLLALAVALAATVGDLAESLVKRDLGIKDLGRIVPGHGGIMDRVDALLFALPAAHLLLFALGI